MRKRRLLLAPVCLAALAVAAGCGGETEPPTNVQQTSARLEGKGNCKGDWGPLYNARFQIRRLPSGSWQDVPGNLRNASGDTFGETIDCSGSTPYIAFHQNAAGLEPGTSYEYRLAIDTSPSGATTVYDDSVEGNAFTDPNAPGQVYDRVTTQAGTPPPTLQQPDGGTNYYAQFSDGFPTVDTYFPLGTWLQTAELQSQIDADKAAGLNLYVGVANPPLDGNGNPQFGSDLELVRNNSMKALIQANERTRFSNDPVPPAKKPGSETAGWLVWDEMDMQLGPGNNPYDPSTHSCGGGGNCGYTAMNYWRSTLPSDGKARYANYGKGVMFWESDAEAEVFVNDFQELTSNDIYWFTDPNERARPGYGFGSSYGATVDRMQFLDGLDGGRKPIWNFVEVGWPFTESAAQGGRAIEPAEIKSAVWHSIIAGARGILYFDHQFGGPCTDRVVRGPCYPANKQAVTEVNQQIKDLAPVLNAQFVTSQHSATGNVKYAVKWSGGKFYFLAGADTAGGNAAFALPCIGNATATVLGESRTVPVAGGSFTDSFANKNAVHIYRIDGGSTCGLPAG